MSQGIEDIATGVTLDAFTARDLDDAFWCERTSSGWRLKVSVVDSPRLIPQGSPADRLAASRGLTQYAPGTEPLPMIDREFALNRMSLLPGETRPAIVLTMNFNADGTPSSGTAERGLFRSRAKLSYQDYEDLSHPAADPVARRFVQDSTDLAAALWRLRVARAGMPDWESGFDIEGRTVANLRPGILAQTVLHEIMVANNAAATRLVTSAGLPMIYRNQGGGSGGRGGRYDGVNRGHAALGVDAYGQFTSSIRRFVDLVNQRLLVAAIQGDPSPYTRTEIAEISAAANRTAQRSSAIQRHHAVKMGIPVKRERPLLERMDGSAFTEALESSSPEVVHEALRRLDDGMLTAGNIGLLLSPGGPLDAENRGMVLRRAIASPGIPEAVLRQQLGGRDAYDTESREVSGIWACAVLLEEISGHGEGDTPAGARHQAMSELLARAVCGMKPIPGEEATKPFRLANETAEESLAALARSTFWSEPVYQVRSTPGVGLFRASVQADVGSFVYRSPSATASTEAEARNTVATIALDALAPVAAEQISRDIAVHGPDYTDLREGLPHALEEFCARNGISYSVDWTTERPSDCVFACLVVLRQANDELVADGAGTTREEAIARAEASLAEILIPDSMPIPRAREEIAAPVAVMA